jgi:hypothetical protein
MPKSFETACSTGNPSVRAWPRASGSSASTAANKRSSNSNPLRFSPRCARTPLSVVGLSEVHAQVSGLLTECCKGVQNRDGSENQRLPRKTTDRHVDLAQIAGRQIKVIASDGDADGWRHRRGSWRYAVATMIRPALRERGFRRITISTSWPTAVNRFISRSTEKPASL